MKSIFSIIPLFVFVFAASGCSGSGDDETPADTSIDAADPSDASDVAEQTATEPDSGSGEDAILQDEVEADSAPEDTSDQSPLDVTPDLTAPGFLEVMVVLVPGDPEGIFNVGLQGDDEYLFTGVTPFELTEVTEVPTGSIGLEWHSDQDSRDMAWRGSELLHVEAGGHYLAFLSAWGESAPNLDMVAFANETPVDHPDTASVRSASFLSGIVLIPDGGDRWEDGIALPWDAQWVMDVAPGIYRAEFWDYFVFEGIALGAGDDVTFTALASVVEQAAILVSIDQTNEVQVDNVAATID